MNIAQYLDLPRRTYEQALAARRRRALEQFNRAMRAALNRAAVIGLATGSLTCWAVMTGGVFLIGAA